MTKMNVRHHSVHPPSMVKPNAGNQKPNYVPPPETASMPTPNVNPSLGPVGVDAANVRLNNFDLIDDDCDPNNDPDCEDDSDEEEDRAPKQHLS